MVALLTMWSGSENGLCMGELDELSLGRLVGGWSLKAGWSLPLYITRQPGLDRSRLHLLSPRLQVRVGRLTPTYRRTLLPQLRWFRGLAQDAQMFAEVWDGEGGNEVKVRGVFPSCPDGWFAAERCGALPTGSVLEVRQEMIWRVPRADLEKVIEGASGSRQGYTCGSWFWGGCFWRVNLQLVQPGLELKFSLSTCGKAGLPPPSVLSASFSTTCQLSDGTWGLTKEWLRCWFKSGVSYIPSGMAFPAPLQSVQQLESHLRDGQLVLKAKVWDVR